jgi:Bacteriophage Mu Gp45 spike protein
MQNYEIPRLIRQIVREELAPILMGKIVSVDQTFRATAQRFSTETQIPNMRLIQPYGLASRPKAGMDSMIVPVLGDPSNLQVVGQFDSGRPAIDETEACLYGPDGQVVYMKKGGEIHQGTLAADEPVVLGNVAKEFLGALLDLLIDSAPLAYDSFGLPVELSPEIIEQLMAFKLMYITTPATNIVGQKNFVERGA